MFAKMAHMQNDSEFVAMSKHFSEGEAITYMSISAGRALPVTATDNDYEYSACISWVHCSSLETYTTQDVCFYLVTHCFFTENRHDSISN